MPRRTKLVVNYDSPPTPSPSDNMVLSWNNFNVTGSSNKFAPIPVTKATGNANATIAIGNIWLAPVDGTIDALVVAIDAADPTESLAFTVGKNNVDTTMTVALTGGATSGSDTTHTFSVTAGDTIYLHYVKTTNVSASIAATSINFTPT